MLPLLLFVHCLFLYERYHCILYTSFTHYTHILLITHCADSSSELVLNFPVRTAASEDVEDGSSIYDSEVHHLAKAVDTPSGRIAREI